MPLTLHQAFVPSCQQILGGMVHLIDKAEAHVAETGMDASELYDARLADTMWNLPWHVRAVWVHSAYTLDQIPTGEFTPDFTTLPQDFAAMRAMIAEAQERLGRVDADELESLADTTVGFVLGGKRLMEFTAQNFLLSFNQPNFYFHATTFYDLLRMKGVALGKRDFMGAPRMRG
ncbi:DUF1993 domain-containing protein [Qipengyuania sp. CAU 1752]